MEQAAREEEQPKPPSSPEATTERAVGKIPIAGVIGDSLEMGSFDLRVLDYFTTDYYYCYYYATDLYLNDAQDAISQAGKFVVVNYSVTNTSPQTIEPNPIGQLHVQAPDGKTEVYEQTDIVTPPHRGVPTTYLDDIPPHGMLVSQFIFGVPTDVEPELLAVIYSSQDVGAVDLRDEDPQAPRPEEIVALGLEYYNMGEYEREYALYAQETKDRVSAQVYVSKNWQEDRQGNGVS